MKAKIQDKETTIRMPELKESFDDTGVCIMCKHHGVKTLTKFYCKNAKGSSVWRCQPCHATIDDDAQPVDMNISSKPPKLQAILNKFMPFINDSLVTVIQDSYDAGFADGLLAASSSSRGTVRSRSPRHVPPPHHR